MAENEKDFFCGHSRRDLRAVAATETMKGYIEKRTNLSTWVDVHQLDKTEVDMRAGVKNAKGFIAYINGPIVNPEKPDDDPIMNAYTIVHSACSSSSRRLSQGFPSPPLFTPATSPTSARLFLASPSTCAASSEASSSLYLIAVILR